MSPPPSPPVATEDAAAPWAVFAQRARRHARDACTAQVEAGPLRLSDDGALAYARTRGAWLGVGTPLAAQAELEACAARLRAAAARDGGRELVLFGIERPWRSRALQFAALGAQPEWDAVALHQQFTQHASLRYQLRRAAKRGLRLRRLAPREAPEQTLRDRVALASLHQRWLATRRFAPLGFLLQPQLAPLAPQRLVWLAEQNDHLVGCLLAAPFATQDGAFFDHLWLDPEAPNGTSDSLLAHASAELAAQKLSRVTLGMVPFTAEAAPWLRRASDWLRPIYRADALRAHRERLRPNRWQTVHMAWSSDRSPWPALQAFREAMWPLDRAASWAPLLRWLGRAVTQAR